MEGFDIKKTLPLLILGLAVIAGYIFFVSPNTKPEMDADVVEVFEDAPKVDPRVHRDEVLDGLRVEDTAIFVPDQKSTTQVFLDEIDLPMNGFVVVMQYEDDESGPVLGSSSMLAMGLYKNIALGLNEEVLMGTPMLAVLYEDTNGNGIFEPDLDSEMTDINGSVMKTFFRVNVSE